MATITIEKRSGLKGEITVPGDKSISHRAIMLASIAKGDSKINGFLMGADCLATIDAFKALGIDIKIDERSGEIIVKGKGLLGLKEAKRTLDVKNSGTTMRLLSGILAGNPFKSTLSGDASLNSRPMQRIIKPLS